MAKRLTDSEKWEDPWFMDLSNEDRILWLYVLDKCDHAGIWKVNKPLTEFVLRFKIDWDGFISRCGGRIITIKDKWHIPKFISFQYGVLNPDCRPHRPVIEILKKMDLKGYQYPIDTDKEQEQVKEQEKYKGIVKGKQKFGETGLVLLTSEEHKKLLVKLGERRTAEYINRLENYVGSKGKNYKSHYHTILSWTLSEKPVATTTNSKTVGRDYSRDNEEFDKKRKAWEQEQKGIENV